MAIEITDRAYKWILPLVVGICFGGFAGSVFTWYVNRPKPTVVTYSIATTTLSAPEAAGLIPDLKVQIGGSTIQALYAHNIELLPRQGPIIDQADVAFSFPSPIRIYGIHEESPSILHKLQCVGFTPGSVTATQLPSPASEISDIQCSVHPILFRENETRPFRITIATNRNEAPHVQAVAKGLELVRADQFGPKEQGRPDLYTWLLLAVAALLLLRSALTLFEVRHRDKDQALILERLNRLNADAKRLE
jgi:hypothetical protein